MSMSYRQVIFGAFRRNLSENYHTVAHVFVTSEMVKKPNVGLSDSRN